jgi:hypothetical protein
MRYAESNGHQTRKNKQKDYDAIFNRVISIYLDCISLPDMAASRLDGQGKRTLTGTPLDFKIDVELANRRVLTSPALRDEWARLLREHINATANPLGTNQTSTKPVTAEQRELTNRVILLCARIYAKKKLNRVGDYFRHIRGRIE